MYIYIYIYIVCVCVCVCVCGECLKITNLFNIFTAA